MKVKDLLEQMEWDNRDKITYAAVNFDKDTINRLVQYCELNKIPNPLKPEKFHSTLLYSKYMPSYIPGGMYDKSLVGLPTEFDVWDSSNDGKDTKCLVVQFACPELVNRHNQLMKEHDGTFDFENYQPHVTLSYDIGDMDISKLTPADSIGPLTIVEEFGQTKQKR